jgi:hypothetical protein
MRQTCFFLLLSLGLTAGCHYNEYVNKETGARDTATEDIPTQRTAAPQGQVMQETNNAEKQR